MSSEQTKQTRPPQQTQPTTSHTKTYRTLVYTQNEHIYTYIKKGINKITNKR